VNKIAIPLTAHCLVRVKKYTNHFKWGKYNKRGVLHKVVTKNEQRIKESPYLRRKRHHRRIEALPYMGLEGLIGGVQQEQEVKIKGTG
jgi:hypothetical protein